LGIAATAAAEVEIIRPIRPIYPIPFTLPLVMLVLCSIGPAEAQAPGAESPDQTQIDFANGLFQRGLFKEAAEEYRAYLDKYPQGAHAKTAMFRLGESASAAQDYEGALKAFEDLLAANPNDSMRQQTLLGKGEALYYLNRPADAVLVLEPLTAAEIKEETRARALYTLGKIHTESGDTDAALKTFKSLIEEIPNSPFVPFSHYQLAFAYLARNEGENAAVEFSAVASSAAADENLRMEARFRAAETYDKIGWFSAAVGAYEQLRKDFPDSTYTQRADYGYAWALYHAGKYAEATVAVEAFLKKHPGKPDVPKDAKNTQKTVGMKYLLGNCLQQQKRYDDAIAQYTKIRADYPDSEFAVRSLYKLAWCLYLNGQLEEAKTNILAYLEKPSDPNRVGDAAFLLGTIMVASGDYEKAYEEFRLVSEKYSGSEFGAESLFKAGECLAQLGRTDEAAQVFETFAKQYPENPLTEQALLRVGDAALLTSSFEAAVERYKKIIESPTTPEVEEDTLYRLAITYHNMKQYEESANTFRTLIQKFPKGAHRAEAHLRIADFLLREKKDAVGCIEEYNACLQIEPEGDYAGRAVKGLALARYEMKDYDAAAEMFLRLVSEFPAIPLNEDTYAWTGQHLFDLKKWDQAAVAFKALLQAKPDYPNPERVRFKIAECNESAGKIEEAIDLYQAVAQEAPLSTTAMQAKYRMAKLYEDRKKPDKAFALYEEVANTNTGDTAARARFRLGELYEAQGDYDAAARSYMRIAILFLHEELSPESLWRAGQSFEKAGSVEQAKKAYQELIQDYPDREQAIKAKEILAKLGTTAPATDSGKE